VNKSGIWIALLCFLLCVGCSQPPGGADGYKVAFVPSKTGEYGIFSINSDTTGSKILVADRMAQVRFASWSPDGARLAVGFGIGEYCGIYLISSDGRQSERLTDGATIDFRPAWSPDGKAIAYIAYKKTDGGVGNSSVFVIASNGTGKKMRRLQTRFLRPVVTGWQHVAAAVSQHSSPHRPERAKAIAAPGGSRFSKHCECRFHTGRRESHVLFQ